MTKWSDCESSKPPFISATREGILLGGMSYVNSVGVFFHFVTLCMWKG